MCFLHSGATKPGPRGGSPPPGSSLCPSARAQARRGSPSQALSAGDLVPFLPSLGRPLRWARGGAICERRATASGPRCAQGQVTRAQEAEENYVIKRELAVVRQQCSSAAEDLQKARSTIRQLQEQQVPGRVGPRTTGARPSGPARLLPSRQGRGDGESRRGRGSPHSPTPTSHPPVRRLACHTENEAASAQGPLGTRLHLQCPLPQLTWL